MVCGVVSLDHVCMKQDGGIEKGQVLYICPGQTQDIISDRHRGRYMLFKMCVWIILCFDSTRQTSGYRILFVSTRSQFLE